MNYLFRTFEDVFHCLIIKDLCCSDSDQLIYFITELFVCQELFLNYFLKLFRTSRERFVPCCSLDQQLVYSIKLIRFCQELFSSFFEAVFATRGSHPAPNWVFLFQRNSFASALADSLVIITPPKAKVNTFFRIFLFLEKYS